MTKARKTALIRRLLEIRVDVLRETDDGVVIRGEDFQKVIWLAKGSSYFTRPVGTTELELM